MKGSHWIVYGILPWHGLTAMGKLSQSKSVLSNLSSSNLTSRLCFCNFSSIPGNSRLIAAFAAFLIYKKGK